MNILVTGATGFVGSALCPLLRERGHALRTAGRNVHSDFCVGNIGAATDWREALAGVEVVIHLAGRAHVMKDAAIDPEAAYRQVNVEGSLELARQCAEAGVRRLVYVSSIKVNGEMTAGQAYCEDSAPQPEDAYGRSKLAAEQALAQLAAERGFELVIVRPVMVVGPGAKGNLASLASAVLRGLPLPLGAITNRRSLVSVAALADLLTRCAELAPAAGEVFLAADQEALSTPDIVRALAQGLGRPARLWAVPLFALRLAGGLTGRSAQIKRLTGDLRVDAAKARRVLGWAPAGAAREALRAFGAEIAGSR